MLTARRADRLEALAAEIGNAEVALADLSDPAAVDSLVDEIGRRGLWVRTLINNAGFGLAGQFAALPLDRQREMLRLNVEAVTMLAHRLLPAMLAARQGAILNVASTGAFQAGPGIAVYFASKAYVLSFSEALHQELKGSGIKVSALCPGPTATEFGQVAGVTSARFDILSGDAARVAAAGLDGLARNRAVVIPGIANKVTAQSSRFLPRAAMRRIVASLKL
ncbi:MAG: SDR family NAD(P)-dependent oxidoreductase [Sphingomonadales bacterium]